MDKKEIINKIKDLLTFNATVEKFIEIKDIDGNILKTDGDIFDIGSEISIVSETGEELSGAGEFVLEDGRTIIIGEDSKISEIKPVVEPVDTAMEETIETDEVIDEVETIETIETDEVVDEVVESDSRIEALEELVKELIKNQSKQTEATMSIIKLVEQFGANPVDDTIENLKSEFNAIEKPSKSVNLDEFRKMRTKK